MRYRRQPGVQLEHKIDFSVGHTATDGSAVLATTSESNANQICSRLAWDSIFWGIATARLNRRLLTSDDARKAIEWCTSNDVCCLYFLADGTDPETLCVAATAGFAYVDTRIELEISVPSQTTSLAKYTHRIRKACAADLSALRSIAREAHKDTRFFKDARFARDRAAELYEEWIGRDFAEHTILVAIDAGSPSHALGYITCQSSEVTVGRIGLLGVSEAFRNRGVGSALLKGALEHLMSAGKSIIRVATQGTNVAALRLYESTGFRTHDAGVWFHRWFEPRLSKDLRSI